MIRASLRAFVSFALLAIAVEARADDDGSAAREEARVRFTRGIELYTKKQLDAALAEFLRSRELFPTRAAAFNAARIYRELARYEEAQELLEAIPGQFPSLSQADKDEIDRYLADVRAHIGYVVVAVSEPNATVVIDERERLVPSDGRLAVSAGTHIVRAHKDGFSPFETRVDVAAQTLVKVEAKLGALTRGGRLAIVEGHGHTVAILLDGIEIGKTPWEGTVAVGTHVVTLRGAGDEGSPPTPVSIQLNQLTRLALATEPLACKLRVEPTPRSARVAVDGVELGHGIWEGPLRCGGHLVEIGAEGFVAHTTSLTLTEGIAGLSRASLERDPTSEAFRTKNPPHITVEGSATGLLSPGFGGELANACGDRCSSSPGFGTSVTARAGYRLGLGLGATFDAGMLYALQSREGVTTETRPYGLPAHPGLSNDALRLSGPMFGLSLSYVRGERLPILARVGAGAFLGSLRDARSGTFVAPSGAQYTLQEAAPSFSANSLYLDAEMRAGFHLFRGGTFEVGLRALILTSIGSAPRWGDQTERSLGACPNPDPNVCAGRGVYAPMNLVSGVLALFGPTVGVRGEL
ncbi:MAG TPA: hypothetical protein VM925_15375 [Labilithrix sp.]|nr:hypothetical protein [Labilithrix sp.]